MINDKDQTKRTARLDFFSYLVHNFIFFVSCYFGFLVSIMIDESVFHKRIYLEAIWSVPSIAVLIIILIMTIIVSVIFHFRSIRFTFTDSFLSINKRKANIVVPFNKICRFSYSKAIDFLFSTRLSTLSIKYYDGTRKRLFRVQICIDQATRLSRMIELSSRKEN